MVKRLPAVLETWVLALGWDDPLEKEMSTHSSILAWKIPWTEEPGRLQSMRLQRVGHDWVTSISFLSWHLLFGWGRVTNLCHWVERGRNRSDVCHLWMKALNHWWETSQSPLPFHEWPPSSSNSTGVEVRTQLTQSQCVVCAWNLEVIWCCNINSLPWLIQSQPKEYKDASSFPFN